MKSRFLFLIISCIQINFVVSQSIKENLSIDSIEIKPSIEKYLKISIESDSTYVDTSLTIKKHYKFNFLRKDDLELLKFSNIGQTYNEMTHDFDRLSFLPVKSFSSKKHAYMSPKKLKYYNVPTPFTELLFKTVMKQGQYTNALFTSNISENLNFSIAFKGMRSLGNYQNILSGSKQFSYTTKYNSKRKRYFLKINFVSQNFENQENGGLTSESISNFESKDPLFNERSKLSVKFENATNNFISKRYFISQEFILNKKNKSNQKNTFSVGHDLEYETLTNFFEQVSPSIFYGSANPGLSAIDDKTKIKTTSNKFYTTLNSDFLGEVKVTYLNYNYKYNTNVFSTEINQINENENAISLRFNKFFLGNQFNFNITKSLFGDRLGELLDIIVLSKKESKFKYEIGLNISSRHPGLYYELYKSNYSLLNWDKKIKRQNIRDIYLKLGSSKMGNLRLDLRTIQNYAYFSLNKQNINSNNDNLVPMVNQLDSKIQYLKIKYNREFKFGKFALDNSLIYQQVNQSGDYLNLPELLTRNTFYYSDLILKGAMFFQTGLVFKYFSKFYANEYNPALSSFHIQNQKKIGGFPIMEVFANAKIKQTRLFIKAEHFNSTITGNNFYSSPSYPYRDFIIRFGLVWNFFN